MTLYDPISYTALWVSDTRIFKRESPERLTFFGWYGMFSGVTDLMCAPLNAIERQRDGAYLIAHDTWSNMMTIKESAVLILMALPITSLAHHSRAEFSVGSQAQYLDGELVEIFWRNPHPRFTLRSVNDSGQE